jgi:ATP-binding cassette subfamily B protein
MNMRLVSREQSKSVPQSGISGSTDFPDPVFAESRQGLRAVPRQLGQAVTGTLNGVPRVLVLSWRASRRLTLGLAAATLITGVLPAATAYLTRVLFNLVVQGYLIHTRHTPDRVKISLPLLSDFRFHSIPGLAIAVGIQIAVLGLSAISSTIRTTYQQLLQEKLALLVRHDIMAHAKSLDLEFFEDSASYDLLCQAQREATTRPSTMVTNTFSLLQYALTLFTLTGLLLSISPWLALFTFIAPLPGFISDSRHGHRSFMVARWASPVHRRMDYISSLLTTDTFAKEIRIFGLGDYLLSRFKLLAGTFYSRQSNAIRRRAHASSRWSLLSTLTQGLSYLYIAVQVMAGRLTVGDLVLFNSVSSSLQTVIQGLFQACTGMYENNLYLQEYDKLLAKKPRIEQATPGLPIAHDPRGEIAFESVSFCYPGSTKKALDNVTFRIGTSQKVALVGRNGAGKSTILKLLCRLYEPTEGRILLDGVDIRRIDTAELRKHISCLFQDYAKYQATAKENIGLGDLPHLDDAEIVTHAAERAGAHDTVQGLSLGYDTPLGKWFSKGVELSGGEWQKVALARAFMRDSSILVLDEPTSALDAQAEYDLFLTLKELFGGRTTLYISHRFSTVREADRIFLLEHGKIIEDGSHEQLIELAGEYARLFGLQAAAYTGPAKASATQSA